MLVGGILTFLTALIRDVMQVTWLVALLRVVLIGGGVLTMAVALTWLIYAAMGEFRR